MRISKADRGSVGFLSTLVVAGFAAFSVSGASAQESGQATRCRESGLRCIPAPNVVQLTLGIDGVTGCRLPSGPDGVSCLGGGVYRARKTLSASFPGFGNRGTIALSAELAGLPNGIFNVKALRHRSRLISFDGSGQRKIARLRDSQIRLLKRRVVVASDGELQFVEFLFRSSGAS
jgi:hypothetical protein